MEKTAFNPAGYIPSVTSVTKRDKWDKLKLDNRRDSVTTHPVGVLSCHACPGAVPEGCFPVMVVKQEVRESELKKLLVQSIRELRELRREVKAYLDGYTSRGVRSEGTALARLRKAVER
jgi:hypothetical protein